MQNFLSLWLNAGAQITHGGQVQRPRQKSEAYLALQLSLHMARKKRTNFRRSSVIFQNRQMKLVSTRILVDSFFTVRFAQKSEGKPMSLDGFEPLPA